jgi:hypothetical protein
MGSISDYLENELLDHVFENGAFSQPTNIYVALCTADPTDAGTGASITEPSGGSYARVNHNSWDTAASRLTENTGAVTFPQATSTWGSITHYAIVDAASSGNMLAHGALAATKQVVSGNTPSFADGTIEISFTAGAVTTYLADALLDHAFKNSSYTQPGIWVGLSTTVPTDASASNWNFTEPSGNNYSRVDYGAWGSAASGATTNTSVIQFATPSGTWGTPTYTGCWDAATSGNLLCYGDITDQAIGASDDVEFAASQFDVTLS